jgi:methylmalonyl-CoA/ethylmalonyl-CoA epimerase
VGLARKGVIMKALGIERVVIVVKDVEKAAKQYSELLGVSFWDAGIQEKQGVHAMVSWEAGIELMSPVTPTSAAAVFLQKKGEGVFGVAWDVKDLKEADAHLAEKGIPVVDRFEFKNTPGHKYFNEIIVHPKATSGIFSILVEREEE